jgi:futalosine hydrolase
VPRTLVVSAWDPEIAPLRRTLRASARRWVATAVGVGPVDAAIGAARAIARWRPEAVIFVGTAGTYPRQDGDATIGSVAVAAEIIAVATAALRGEAYLPGPHASRLRTAAALSRQLLRRVSPGSRRRLVVACPTAITRSAALCRRIADATGAALENLEAFGVARAAAAAGLPFAAVLGVSNRVGPSGHGEWRVNHAAASEAACAVVAAHLMPAHG